jgi:hypothetical protein
MSVCPRCGEEHTRCGGHVWRDGEQRPCGRYPIRGARVCYSHGGAAGQVKRKAAERVAAAALLERFPRRSPTEVLLIGLHHADATAQAAIAAGDPDAGELMDRATQLARVAVDKLGPDYEGKRLELMAELMGRCLDAVLESMRRDLIRALVEVDGATGVVERVWPGLVGEIVPRELRALEAGGDG